MKTRKEKLIILNYEDGRVYVYYLATTKTEADIELFMIQKGHRINNCSWMITTEKIIIT